MHSQHPLCASTCSSRGQRLPDPKCVWKFSPTHNWLQQLWSLLHYYEKPPVSLPIFLKQGLTFQRIAHGLTFTGTGVKTRENDKSQFFPFTINQKNWQQTHSPPHHPQQKATRRNLHSRRSRIGYTLVALTREEQAKQKQSMKTCIM
jgi:hypothetical protein